MAVRKSAIRLAEGRIVSPASLLGAMTCKYLGEKYIKIMNENIYKAIDLLLKQAKEESTYTLATWIDIWMTSYKKPRLKPKTYRGYVKMINYHILPELGEIPLGELDGLTLQNFITSILADNTRKKVALILNAALEKAKRLRYIPYNPFDSVELPKAKSKHYKALEFDQQSNVLTNASDKYRPLFFFLCCTGLRIGEFLALDWKKDINWIDGYISVTKTVDIDTGKVGDSPKTESGIRHVPFLDDLVPVIRLLQKETYTYMSCRNYFRRLYSKLRLRGYNLHSFRHTFISVCNSVGMNVKTTQVLVGHSTINLTLDHYTHLLRPGTSAIRDYVLRLKYRLE